MILNKKVIKEARATIEMKRPYWEEKLGVKFDEEGRVEIGTLTSFNEADWREVVLQNISDEFCECFLIGLDELGIRRFNLKNLRFDDYKRKTVTVLNNKGKQVEKKIASLLQKAQDVWEREYVMYRPYRNHMKKVRAEDGGGEMSKLNAILRNLEKGNTYVAYDRLLREFVEKKMYLSINPLDKLFASGGVRETDLTKFNSCWSNTITPREDASYEIQPYGCYANPKAQIILGSHILSGMIMTRNGNSISVDGMNFYGMSQRSHVWVTEGGLFVENIYPDRHNIRRVEEVNALISKKVNVYSPDKWVQLKLEKGIDFNETLWKDDIFKAFRSGKQLYLDRSAITDDGKIWIGPRFRCGGFGGTYQLPR